MKKKKCNCIWCRKWIPLERKIDSLLKGKDRKLFDEYTMMVEDECTARCAAEAKLAGDWPDWEWMKLEVKKHRK